LAAERCFTISAKVRTPSNLPALELGENPYFSAGMASAKGTSCSSVLKTHTSSSFPRSLCSGCCVDCAITAFDVKKSTHINIARNVLLLIVQSSWPSFWILKAIQPQYQAA